MSDFECAFVINFLLFLDTDNGSFIIMPLTGTINQRTLFGYSYIPLIESPGILYLLDEEKVLRSLDFSLIYSVSKLWPLLFFIYIGAAIFGMIVWALVCKNLLFFSFLLI